MNYVLKKLLVILGNTSPQAIVATVLATHVAILALRAVPELSCTIASSLIWFAELGRDHLSSPNPPAPAGDITLRVIRIWTNHVAEVELPRLRLAAARIDCEVNLTVAAGVLDSSLSATESSYLGIFRRRVNHPQSRGYIFRQEQQEGLLSWRLTTATMNSSK